MFNEVTKSSERLKTVYMIWEVVTTKSCLREVGKVMRNSSRAGRGTKVEDTSDPLQPQAKRTLMFVGGLHMPNAWKEARDS